MAALVGLLSGLIVDTIYSWLRMFAALFISIIISFFVGIFAARSRIGEKLILPLVDIFQTLPILAFFPIAIFLIVGFLPGYIGINAAVIFLVVTSMIWNIIFGVYEAIKTMPNEFLEIASTYHLGPLQRLTKIYAPAALPRITEQSILSWSIGLFYLVTSEIFSAGSATYEVHRGIGIALTGLASGGQTFGYVLGIIIFILFVIGTRFLFFVPLQNYAYRYSRENYKKERKRYHFDINELFIKKVTYFGAGFAKRTSQPKRHLIKKVGQEADKHPLKTILYPFVFLLILISGLRPLRFPTALNITYHIPLRKKTDKATSSPFLSEYAIAGSIIVAGIEERI